MSIRVDLNADMGEGVGDEASLLQIVTSANVACGMHAGDPLVMARTMALAARSGVQIGAHPGFDDRANFGRTRMALPAEDLSALVAYQVGAAMGMAKSQGLVVSHLKLHGALANMCADDEAMAKTAYEAALSVAPDLPIMVIAATAQQRAATALGARVICEVFADRAYNDDATLVDRSLPGAVIHDPEVAAARMVDMVTSGAILTATGARLPTAINSICCHGDTPEAVAIARAVRAGLEAAGVTVTGFEAR